ncbi:MAG: 4Fe-4S ferredoxin [Sphaerochaetaceae bacterium]|jgi:Fe-S-cluster-containing hydrogenase component 2
MHAVRNLALCTKDCICLFVCPTGATNTETGQIDFEKCLDGCRLCIDACPSNALYLSYDNYPETKAKDKKLVASLEKLLESKATQEVVSKNLDNDKLIKAFVHSNRVLAEDCAREAAYMLPQSNLSKEFLKLLLDKYKDDDFPKEAVEKLLKLL